MKQLRQKAGKAVLLALLLALMAGLLAGCGGEMTAEKLAQRMAKASRRAQMTQLTLTSGLVVQLEGQTQETGFRTVAEMQLSAKTQDAFADVSAGTIGEGILLGGESQVWLQPEQESLAAYICNGSSMQWIREEQSMPEGNGTGALGLLAELDPSLLELAPEEEEVNGTRVWRLTVSLTPQQLSAVLGRAAVLQAAAGVLDWEDAAVIETVFYVSTRSRLPVRIEIRTDGLTLPDEFAAGLLAGGGYTVLPGSGRLHAFYDAIGYDKKVEVTPLPAQGQSSAVSNEELLTGGALYAIEENGQQVLLRVPADWQAYGQATDTVTLARPDGLLTVTYTMYTPDVDGRFFRTLVEEQEIPMLQAGGSYLSHGEGTAIGGFENMWVKCEGMTICYAWTEAGDACLYLRVVAIGEELEAGTVLRPLLEQVER